MSSALAALLLFAVQPAPVAPAVEPLEPRGCGAFWSMVFFESGSAELTSNGRLILDNLLDVLRSNTFTSPVRLTGHADRVGRPGANLALSRRRAMAVRNYLVAHGTAPDLISTEAWSETRVLVETGDGVTEAQNRRVEILEMVPAEIIDRWNAWTRIHGYSGPIC